MAAGRAKDTADGNDEAAVGRGGVIRVIRVICLIRDSDTAGWGRARTGGGAERAGTHCVDNVRAVLYYERSVPRRCMD